MQNIQHATEFIFSLLTIAFAIIAIVMFIIYHGASLAFYVTMAMALAIGFINAWLISKTGAAVPAKTAAPQPRRATRRRRGT